MGREQCRGCAESRPWESVHASARNCGDVKGTGRAGDCVQEFGFSGPNRDDGAGNGSG